MSKYTRLAEHLRTHQANAWRASFVEIEDLLRTNLPPSARKYAEWWSNGGGRTQTRAWVDAGFKTCELDMSRQTVLFRRTGVGGSDEVARRRPNRRAHARRRAERLAAKQPNPPVPHGTNSLALCGHDFEWTAEITPDTGADGQPIECMPQANYAKINEKPLNRHGKGPFCRFSIPDLPAAPGLYAVTVDRRLAYVGIAAKNLRQRWGPSGYAEIQPVNCFRGGQSTNCKINHAILCAVRDKQIVELWMRRHNDPRPVEAVLIRELDPPWNDQR